MREPIYILALETSSSICDVALLTLINGMTTVYCASHEGTAQHAERLLPLVDTLLAEAAIERSMISGVAFGQGPGGFTGLRVACGAAQGIAFSLGIKVMPVVSLRAAAYLDEGQEPVRVVVQDARMNEVYAAAYCRNGAIESRVSNDVHATSGWHTLHKPVLLNVDDIPLWLHQQTQEWSARQSELQVKLIGDALDAYPELVASVLDSTTQAGQDEFDVQQCPISIRAGEPIRGTAEAVARLGLTDFLEGRVLSPEEAAPLYVRDKVAFTTRERLDGRAGNPKAQWPALIEVMTADDLDEVLQIERSVQSFPWTRGNFADALRAGYAGWVTRKEEKIQGFYVAMFGPDVAHLLLIAVRPASQRCGLGYQLLQHFEAQAAQRRLAALLLEVRASNRQAIVFYENRGFRQIGQRKDYYRKDRLSREDALIMEKRILLDEDNDG